MAKKQPDAERIHELRLKIWGTVAKNFLHENEDPFLIKKSQIEGHKGRINKALRLTRDIVSFDHTEDTSRYSSTDYYRVDHFDKSKELLKT